MELSVSATFRVVTDVPSASGSTSMPNILHVSKSVRFLVVISLRCCRRCRFGFGLVTRDDDVSSSLGLSAELMYVGWCENETVEWKWNVCTTNKGIMQA